jgi:Protein of unknown function (DUF2637)
MSNQPQGGTAHPADSHRGLRLFGLIAVAVGVLVLMAAAFVLSYTGIHAIALSAGVSPRFARIYPVIFDAMLVVACAAVLALRGAGLPSRCYAWLTMLVLLAAAAAADTVHATNTKLPHKPTAAAAAIIPWVLVLLGFGLLLSMLRHARLRRAGLAGAPDREFTQPSGHVEVRQRHGLDDLFGPRSTPDAPAVRYVPPARPVPPAKPAPLAERAPAAETAPDLAIESDPGHDDPSSDEGHPAARPERQEQAAGSRGNPASAFSPAPTLDLADDVRVISAPGDKPAETGTVPVPRRAPVPVLEARPAQNAKPAPDAKETGGPKAAGKARLTAKAEPTAKAGPKAAAETPPAPKTKPAAKAKPAPRTGPMPEPAAAAEPEPLPGATSEAGAIPEDQPGSGSKSAAKPGTTAGPEAVPDAESAPPYDPEDDPLQFERVRSSPMPPGS